MGRSGVNLVILLELHVPEHVAADHSCVFWLSGCVSSLHVVTPGSAFCFGWDGEHQMQLFSSSGPKSEDRACRKRQEERAAAGNAAAGKAAENVGELTQKKYVLSCLGRVWTRERVLAKCFCSVPSLHSHVNRDQAFHWADKGDGGRAFGLTSPEAHEASSLSVQGLRLGETQVPGCARRFGFVRRLGPSMLGSALASVTFWDRALGAIRCRCSGADCAGWGFGA